MARFPSEEAHRRKKSIRQARAFARVNLGVKRDEFDALTRADFDDLVEQWEAREAREDRRAAMTPWILATIHTKKGEKPPKLTDYMPKKPTSTKEDNAAAQRAMREALMGMVNRGA